MRLMSSTTACDRIFQPGTTGWTASDLDDPRIAGSWFRGRYEIVEGVLTTKPAAYFTGSSALFELMSLVKAHATESGFPGSFAPEVDIVIDEQRVLVADAVFLTPSDKQHQQDAAHLAGRTDPTRTRLL